MGEYIEVIKLNKQYDGKVVFKNLNMRFQKNQINVIMGPSGSGKTTLIRILMGLENFESGEIGGLENLKKSVVFQEDRLCEDLSGIANIMLPHDRLEKSEKEIFISEIIELSKSLDMKDAVSKAVGQLSGGQKRRVAILRGALAKYDVIFFDEPMQGIDEESKKKLMDVLIPLLKEKTVFWITHNIDELEFFDNPNLLTI